MGFEKIALKDEFTLHNIISLHYFEFAKDFIFSGERHDFWEFVYVDKGEVEVTADSAGYTLKQGEIIFHKPDEFHSVWANHRIAPNLIVVSFECKSESMNFFENKIFPLGDHERNLITNILKEGFNAFHPPFDDPQCHTLQRVSNQLFGCEQMIKINLQLLLLNIVRKGRYLDKKECLSTLAKERSDNDMLQRIIAYLKENIHENVTLNQICRFSKMGKTQVVALFRKNTGMSTIEYFKGLKIEQAKKMIREETHNLTEISEILGYSSIHGFSRHFRNATGMSATQYAKTVKAKLMQ